MSKHTEPFDKLSKDLKKLEDEWMDDLDCRVATSRAFAVGSLLLLAVILLFRYLN